MVKKVHLEIIRLIAICLVIFNHTDGYFLYFSLTENKITYIVSLFFSVFAKINVPLFFVVTGALLIGKEEDIRTLYKKRVARMVIVILIFSAVQYIALGLTGKAEWQFSIGNFLKTVYSSSVIEPYWFLYSYLAILIILPFLRKMAKAMGEKEFIYLFILKIIIDVCLRLAAVYSGSTINLELFILSNNVFYVLLGYYLEHVLPEAQYKKMPMGRMIIACGCIIVAAMAATIADFKVNGAYSQNCLGIFNPILVIMVYYIIRSLCIKRILTEKLQKVLIYLGSTVFGIYLIEQLVRRQLLPLYLYLCDKTVGLLACFIYVLATIMLSIVYVSILKKIPGIKKLV